MYIGVPSMPGMTVPAALREWKKIEMVRQLEEKILKAQDEVVKAKKTYDEKAAKLEDLLTKRDALKKEELLKAIAESNKTYDEILKYIKSE